MADPEEAQTQLGGDRLGLGEVLADLDADVVDALQRRAGELELAAGLEADAGAAAGEPDQGLAAGCGLLEDFRPAEPLEAGEQGVDAGRALVGDGGVGGDAEDELLVLGADAEGRPGLTAPLEVGHQILEGEGAVVTEGFGHSRLPPASWRVSRASRLFARQLGVGPAKLKPP